MAQTRLHAIENEIITIVGDDIENYTHWESIPEKRSTVKARLFERCNLLNNLFQPTKKNMQRFKAVNDRLYTLTHRLFTRFAKMEQKLPLIMDSPDWDDDYHLEGWLRFIFNDAESVLNLPDDTYYGSHFALMIKTLYELHKDTGIENIESVYHGTEPLDDGQSWNEPPFYVRKEFDDIIICHAIHNLCNHKLYSIPDLLRLNDFWCEVQITAQSITNQNGIRWKPQD